MMPEERKQGAVLLGGLAETLGQTLSLERIDGMLGALDDVPLGLLAEAVAEASMSSKFMPAPVELRTMARDIARAKQLERPALPELPVKNRAVPAVPTLAEMAENCAINAADAKRLSQVVLRQMEGTYPGPGLEGLKIQLSRHLSDHTHWANYASHYRARAAREGGQVVPKVTVPARRGA